MNDYFFKLYNPGVAAPDFHCYQEGGAIGGPILHDKLFFFADYEATQQTTLIGMGSGGQFTKDIIAAEANPYYAAFVQDTYHLSPRLTINAGLRWEIFGGRTERHNRREWFDPNLAYTVNGVSLKGGECFVSSGDRTPFSTNMTDFAPRLGIGWQVEKNLVFHAGGGIYYGPSVEMVANSALNGDGFAFKRAIAPAGHPNSTMGGGWRNLL